MLKKSYGTKLAISIMLFITGGFLITATVAIKTPELVALLFIICFLMYVLAWYFYTLCWLDYGYEKSKEKYSANIFFGITNSLASLWFWFILLVAIMNLAGFIE